MFVLTLFDDAIIHWCLLIKKVKIFRWICGISFNTLYFFKPNKTNCMISASMRNAWIIKLFNEFLHVLLCKKERKRKAKGWRWKSYKCFLQYRRKNEEMYGQAIIFMTQIKYNNGIPCLLSDKFEFVKNIKGMLCFFGVADLCENPITPT